MKKLLSIALCMVVSASMYAYTDLIALKELKAQIDQHKEINYIKQVEAPVDILELSKAPTDVLEQIKSYNNTVSVADFKLYELEQTNPEIFNTIESAEKATDIGYFRLRYRKANNLNKLNLIKTYFNLTDKQ